jgi:putative endonuclease
MKSRQIGDLGERIAGEYLKKKGYRILAKNYYFRIPGNPQKGEIDIIAQKRDLISFFEVKTLIKNGREQFSAISPEEKVNFSKMRKLAKAAESWLMRNKIPLNSKWQIDILAIEIEKDGPAFAKASAGKKAEISHFENAVPYL